MISSLLHTFSDGLKIIKSNSKLLLIVVLLFVFPLLFIYITEQFFATAQDNINTSEKQRVHILHTALRSIITETDNGITTVNALIPEFIADNQDISDIRVIEEKSGEYIILASADNTQLNQLDANAMTYSSLPIPNNGEPFIFELQGQHRTWQVFQAVVNNESRYIIFTEHEFHLTDSMMSARRQQSYFGLTAIFLFLIALAYWIHRQDHWFKRYVAVDQKIKERDLFSNMIAHEFRTPLTAIKGYASFLQESGSASSDERRYATNISVSAERLVLLVNDFLEVARLQSGKLPIERSIVDVRTILKRVQQDLASTAKEKNLTLTYHPNKKPVQLFTDPDRLIQVLTNIITNSLKYTKEGNIELECQDARDKVTIRIMDTGMGISAEDQQKLFAPFTRVGGVDQTDTTGTGLGMWITKQLVTLLDGHIGVESIKGIGTHVVITFKHMD